MMCEPSWPMPPCGVKDVAARTWRRGRGGEHVAARAWRRGRGRAGPPGVAGCPAVLRSFGAGDFPAHRVREAKGRATLSVVIPARDEETTVGSVVEVIRRSLMEDTSVVDELVVVDDGSSDATAVVAAGAGAVVVST